MVRRRPVPGRRQRRVHGDRGGAPPRDRHDQGRGRDHQGEARAAAGSVYPQEILDLYTGVPDGAIGPWAQQLLDEVIAKSPSDNPFDLADTMQNVLLSSEFSYNTNLTDVNCEPSAVECFARIKKGYCLHFASAMAILLRDAMPGKPIPTRLVEGFLPGEINGTTSTVRIRDAHAWVEVYFPGFGWIPFDPTKQVGLPTKLIQGQPVPSASSLLPPPSFVPPDQEGPSRRPGTPAGPIASAGGSGPDGRVLLTVFAVILAAGVLALAFAAWLSGPAQRGGARRGVAVDGTNRKAPGLRAASHPDGLRVRVGAGGPRARRAARHRHGRDARRSRPRTRAPSWPARGSTRSVRRPAGSASRCSASRSAGRGAAGAPDRRAARPRAPRTGPASPPARARAPR